MKSQKLTFLEAERLNDEEIVIAFSDGSSAVYDVKEILDLPAERLNEEELERRELERKKR